MLDCLPFGYSDILPSYNNKNNRLLALAKNQEEEKEFSYTFTGRIDKARKAYTKDAVANTSVHESGHAIVYSVLFNLAPVQIKSRLASSESAGFTVPHLLHRTKENIQKEICVLLSGMASEEEIFGAQNVSSGSSGDIARATQLASDITRKLGMSRRLSKTLPVSHRDAHSTDTEISSTNHELRQILLEQFKRARKIVADNKDFLLELSDLLINKGEISGDEFVKIARTHGVDCTIENENYIVSPKYTDLMEVASTSGN